ncbi:Na+/H+ antiporter subunit G [Ectothiorhodospira mobilis]|uniref:Multisubunit potassium/proton antiporter, PhaG subunit n=1 Tax=Ectothiorhodospira mobilis TaxID=195064 RepID=A0A1I4Q0K5_ECTMO|nr:Na+/H+ antiporter subunit G [Ectothiorhodospira mobilis]MCG5536300.1 Na+/H+ antiporter subunit G [Ectothiorhodospira mobilis]SFM33155.1 multisubunit potassium/proton antiporter, PhaG subunit [Ectothiorhodospira mobilis]
MAIWLEALIALLIVVSGVFILVGSLGLLKLPTLMMRLHAPTKATTLGVGGALLASMGFFWAVEGTISVHELLVTAFLFLTAPVTAHFIAKAHLHLERKRDGGERERLPQTGTGSGWSTYDPAPQTGGEEGDSAPGEG